MDAKGEQPPGSIDRRRLLQAIGGLTTVGLAGCSESGSGNGGSGSSDGGSSGDGDGELGERVPELTLTIWGGRGAFTAMHEDSSQIIQNGVEDLGITLNIEPVEYLPSINRVFNDARQTNFAHWLHNTTPDRLDPHTFTRRYAIDWAGANEAGSPTNWANCEYSVPAVAQASAPDPETRQELINEAQSVMSREKSLYNLAPYVNMGAMRQDKAEAERVGDGGIGLANFMFWTYLSPTDGDTLVANCTPGQVNNLHYQLLDSVNIQAVWNQLFAHPLVNRDQDFNVRNALAESVDIENDAKRIIVELQQGTTFHNGDPLTSEDVQFTFQYLDDYAALIANASTAIPYESIDIVDDRTVEFNLSRAFLPLITRTFPKWGIVHKNSWEEVYENDDPQDFEPEMPIIGSGPFELDNFERGVSMRLTPFEDFVDHVPDYDLIFQVYRDVQTVYQAFVGDEIQVMTDINADLATRAEEDLGDDALTTAAGGTLPFVVNPQCSFGAVQFQPFRDAFYTAINRQQICDVVFGGQVEPDDYCASLMPRHPNRAPDEVLTEIGPRTGDLDLARQKLEDAGYGWDDNGNLHFPPDTDLSPLWPQGETPSPDDFPCLNQDGEVEFDPEEVFG